VPKYLWPRWLLWALSPLLLSLGFLSGVLLAMYLTGQPPANPQPSSSVPQPPAPTTGIKPGETPWRIPTEQPAEEPIIVPPDPNAFYHEGPINSIRKARGVLASEFGYYALGDTRIQIEYQQMRHGGAGRSVVGMIAAADYPYWRLALQEEPEELENWLLRAASRVLPATQEDPFHLSWSVLDVLRERPEGFTESEVIPMENRTYLVIRPLASTVDHTKPAVSLRGLESLRALGPHDAIGSPWAVYGPVLRFDATDLYRPPRLGGSRPIKQ
jgi:hypothetical protein